MANTKVGKRIAELRSERNLTQRQLAAALRYSEQTVEDWENGESLPSGGAVDALAAYFHVDAAEFLSSPKTYVCTSTVPCAAADTFKKWLISYAVISLATFVIPFILPFVLILVLLQLANLTVSVGVLVTLFMAKQRTTRTAVWIAFLVAFIANFVFSFLYEVNEINKNSSDFVTYCTLITGLSYQLIMPFAFQKREDTPARKIYFVVLAMQLVCAVIGAFSQNATVLLVIVSQALSVGLWFALAAATEDKQDVVTYTSKYPPKSRY